MHSCRAPVTYTYDATNQLLSDETSSPYYSNEYEYDLAGNRTERDGTANTIDDGNRVVSDGTYTYEYDEEGNLVKRTHIQNSNERVLIYDYRNRLIEVKDYSGSSTSGTLQQHVQYEYDTFNRRVARWVDGDGNGTSDREEFFIYDGDDVVLDFVDANGSAGGVTPTVAVRYLHGPAVDQILALEDATTNETLWMLTDHLGSVRDIVNNNGAGVSHITYDAFGNLTSGTGALLTRYLWTGREHDSETGLQYNRNRWYDPALGRWTSEDPIGYWGGDYNLGRYVANIPTNWIDPDGLVVIVAARDLNGPPIGTHQFIVLIPDNPNDFGDAALQALNIPGLTQLRDLGNNQKGIVIGAHNINGRLKVKAFEAADLKAFLEVNDPDKYMPAGLLPDFDCEKEVITAPKGKSDTDFIKDLLERASNYIKNEDTSNIPYPRRGGFLAGSNSVNSNSWVQSMISDAGGKSKGDFSGADLLHKKRIDPRYFADPANFK